MPLDEVDGAFIDEPLEALLINDVRLGGLVDVGGLGLVAFFVRCERTVSCSIDHETSNMLEVTERSITNSQHKSNSQRKQKSTRRSVGAQKVRLTVEGETSYSLKLESETGGRKTENCDFSIPRGGAVRRYYHADQRRRWEKEKCCARQD